MVLIGREYGIGDDGVGDVWIGRWLRIGNVVFYFVGEFCPIGFFVVGVGGAMLGIAEVGLGVN